MAEFRIDIVSNEETKRRYWRCLPELTAFSLLLPGARLAMSCHWQMISVHWGRLDDGVASDMLGVWPLVVGD